MARGNRKPGRVVEYYTVPLQFHLRQASFVRPSHFSGLLCLTVLMSISEGKMPTKSIIELNRTNGDTPIVIYFQLIEKSGDRVELLLQDVQKLADRHELGAGLTVEDIHQLHGNETSVVYGFNPEEIPDPRLGVKFLETLFKQFFDKHPTYVEPPSV